MTFSEPASEPAASEPATHASAPAPRRGLRLALAVVAAIELMDALSNVSIMFHDYGHRTALLKFAQALISVELALSPLIAGTALVFAALGRMRQAILALAALVLTRWLLDYPTSVAIHGWQISADFGGAMVLLQFIALPLAAGVAAVLAWRHRRLGLATLLVSLPTVARWAGVLAFAVGVALYGF